MSANASLPIAPTTPEREPRWFFGSLAQVKASAADTGGQYTLLEILSPPNLESPLHVHYREDEGFYVLEGSVRVEAGDQVVELRAGQHAFGPRNVPHRFAVGPEGARMLWILTPGGFEDLVEEAGVPAEALTVPPADVGPPDDVLDIVRRHGNEILAR